VLDGVSLFVNDLEYDNRTSAQRSHSFRFFNFLCSTVISVRRTAIGNLRSRSVEGRSRNGCVVTMDSKELPRLENIWELQQ
jgi:hypothetical protein